MAVAAFGTAAYLTWANERKKVVSLEHRLSPKIRLFLHDDSSGHPGIEIAKGPKGEELPHIQVSAEPLTEATIYDPVANITNIEHRPDKSARELAPLLAELKGAGMSARQMAAQLTTRGIPTPTGARWHAQTVIRMLNRAG